MKNVLDRRGLTPRRVLLYLMLGGLMIFVLAGCGGEPAQVTATVATRPPDTIIAVQPTLTPQAPAQAPTPAGQGQASPAAPECTRPAEPTPAMTEGPYFKSGSPERASLLEPGMTGTKLVLTGYVLTTDCQPVPNARLEFWQADAEGNYDNSGYRLRGHLFTDASGRYELTTIVPGQYPGRTEHIHVKVQPPNGPVLTSQLFMPDAPGNRTDRIFDERLVIKAQESGDGLAGRFDFVVNAR